MAEVEIKFSATGASIVYDEIKKVSRSVDEVKQKMRAPIGGEMDVNAFGVKAMQQATGALHTLGIEYEKTRGKMKSPLVSPESLMSVQQFTKKGYSKDLKEFSNRLGEAGNNARNAGINLNFMERILAAMAIRAAAREIYNMANAFQVLQNKIKTVTDSGSVSFITHQLYQSAQEARVALESVATVYTRTTRSVQHLGKSQAEVLNFTNNLSKAITVGGSTAVEASNAMIQLSQGMGSGALRGDELRSVLEQLPIVAELIADKLGVPVSALRKLGAEGVLTTDLIFDAINEGQTKVDGMLKKMEVTVPQAWERFKNAAIMASEKSKGVLDVLAKTIETLTAHIDQVVLAVESLSYAFGIWMAMKAASWVLGLAEALKAARVAQVGLNVATLANPWVAAGTAVVALTAALISYVDGASKATEGTEAFINKMEHIKDAFDTTEQQANIRDLNAQIDKMNASLEKQLELQMKASQWNQPGMGPSAQENAIGVFLGGGGAHAAMSDEDIKNIVAIIDKNDQLIKAEAEALLRDESVLEKKYFADEDAIENLLQSQADRLDDLAEGGTRKIRVLKAQQKVLRELTADQREMMSDKDMKELWGYLWKQDLLSHPDPKGEKVTTFEDVMSKANKADDIAELNRFSEQTARIEKKTRDLFDQVSKSQRAGMGYDDLMGARGDSILQVNLDIESKMTKEARAKLEAERESVKVAREKTESLRAIVAHEEYLIQLKKDQEFTEKEMNKSIDEKLKLLQKEEKQLAKIRETQINERNNRNFGIRGELDPTVAIREEINQLERFKAEMQDFPEWVAAAQKKIDELTMSLHTAGANIMFIGQLKSIYGPGGTISQGFSDIAAKAIIMNLSLRETKDLMNDLLATISQQALSSLFQLGINSAFGALGNVLSPAPSATSMPGLMGPNGQPTNITMVPGTFSGASGGYTGDYGVNEVAGIVHGQEFVLNAKATSAIGPQVLSYMNKTGKVPSQEKSAPVPQVTVHNYAGVQVETSVSKEEIMIMIDKSIKQKTPGIVAGAVNNPNSQVSRSLQKNLETERRRR